LQQTVESNRTLLVDGPASVKLVSGRSEVFGCRIRQTQRVVVREGKRLPFYVLEKATFDLSVGPNAILSETSGNTVPNSWGKPLESIRNMRKPVVVMVLGKADSGKSSYCTFLVNNLVDGKCRIAVLDGDVGQSDIGPSGTVSYALSSKQIAELYDLKLENAFFVGVTSPIMALDRTLDGMIAMLAEINQKAVDFVIVNSDGWVQGEIAIRYKTALIKELKPDIIVGVQAQDELNDLIPYIDQKVVLVETPSSLSQRTAEKRKMLREMTYMRYLKDSKLRSYPTNKLVVEPRNTPLEKWEPEKGLLVGLFDFGNQFLGIGVLREIDQRKKALKVQAAVLSEPSRIVLGRVRLDENFREIQG